MTARIPSRGRVIRRRAGEKRAEASQDALPVADGATPAGAAEPAARTSRATRSAPPTDPAPAPAPAPRLDGQALLDELNDLSAGDLASLLGGGAPTRRRPGERVEGTVVRVHGGVAFVDIGGKAEAVLSQEDWGRAPLPRAGTRVTAFVVSVGDAGVRVSKRIAGQGAWEALEAARASGEALAGTVQARNPGGFTVQLGTVKAFCPVSQIDRIPDTDLDRYVGRTLDFRVVEIRDRDVVVSHRAIAEESVAEQAQAFWQRAAVGDQVSGVVVAVKDFGAFVDVDGVRGLVPRRELGWAREAEAPPVGSSVEPVIIALDPTQERLTLSLKSASQSPWERVGSDFLPGGDYVGTVSKVTDFGAFVTLAPGLEGLVHVSELSAERVEHPSSVVSRGASVRVRILDIDPGRQRLKLSIKRAGEPSEDRPAPAPRQHRDAGKLGTLGDLFGGLKLKR